MVRNDTWTLLLRRPLDVLAAHTDRMAALAAEDPDVARGLAEALTAADELWPQRRPLPPWLEDDLEPRGTVEPERGGTGPRGQPHRPIPATDDRGAEGAAAPADPGH